MFSLECTRSGTLPRSAKDGSYSPMADHIIALCLDINCNIPSIHQTPLKRNPIIRNSLNTRLSYFMAVYLRNIPASATASNRRALGGLRSGMAKFISLSFVTGTRIIEKNV